MASFRFRLTHLNKTAMYLSVSTVKPLADYRLLLQFENGESRIFDVKPYLNTGKFAELHDIALFNSVHVSFDSVEWANRLDIDPEFLYEQSKSTAES